MTSRLETLNANGSIYEKAEVDLGCLDLWHDLVAGSGGDDEVDEIPPGVMKLTPLCRVMAEPL